MRYRLLIVIGVLAVLVMPTVSAAAPVGPARSAQPGSCPKVRHVGSDPADGRIVAGASC